MLRRVLLILALGAFAVGTGARLAGYRDATPLALWGGVIAAAVLLERWRYASRGEAAGGDWQATGERFIDPETGEAVQVYFNPRTGERRYGEAPHA